MRPWLLIAALPWLAIGPAATARAAPPAKPPPVTEDHTVAATATVHSNPRLKLSFRQLTIANLDGGKIPLVGAQLDAYPLSRRWVRLGLELEGGAGDASLDGHSAGLWYALAGVSLGVQYPARVTPFIDGRCAVGLLGGQLKQAAELGAGVSLAKASAVTGMLVGGIDVGIELYVVRRVYVSLAVGWAHPVYRGVDYSAIKANPSAEVTLKDVSADTFTFKLGFGI
jgi:hypothetical protein